MVKTARLRHDTQPYSELITSWISRTRFLTSLNRDTYQNIIMKDAPFVKLLNRTPWTCNSLKCNFKLGLISVESTLWTGQCQLISLDSGLWLIQKSIFLCYSMNSNEYFQNLIKLQWISLNENLNIRKLPFIVDIPIDWLDFSCCHHQIGRQQQYYCWQWLHGNYFFLRRSVSLMLKAI